MESAWSARPSRSQAEKLWKPVGPRAQQGPPSLALHAVLTRWALYAAGGTAPALHWSAEAAKLRYAFPDAAQGLGAAQSLAVRIGAACA